MSESMAAWRLARLKFRRGKTQDTPDALLNELRCGHAATLRFNRKGDYLAAGRVDGKIIIWDMETMGVGMKLHGHFKQIQSLSWSHCGRYLLSASQDWRVILWDLQTQQRIRIIKFDGAPYLAELHPFNRFLFVVCIFEDRPYLVDCTPKDATKYSLRTKPLSEAPLPAAEVKQQTTVAIFSWLGSHILTGTSKGYINLIETESRKRIHSTKITTGLISLLRLSSNGSQLIVNSTDRIIRVIDMPDLSVITPKNAITKHGDTKRVRQASASAEDVPTPAVEAMTVAEEITTQAEEGASPDPTTLAENIMLTITHKFQDLVNKLRWNDCAFSHASSNGSSDYVTASTYMKKDVYIWELRTNSLLRILESKEEPAIIQWHPKKPILATIAVDTGGITIWGVEPQQKWSALAPDFAEVDENVEYVEREDDFDEFPEEEHRKRRLDREDEPVDVLTIEKTKEEEEESFVLPMMYDIEVSDDEEELVRTGVGTMRKKEVNEGKEWEDRDTEMVNGVTQPRSRKRRG